jgi:dolichyl-phosphate-mannose--protein O-mannosyl transferase
VFSFRLDTPFSDHYLVGRLTKKQMLRLFLFFSAFAEGKDSDKIDRGEIPLTYYSLVKARHVATDLFLSSMELMYHNGSHGQMMRTTHAVVLAETFWAVFPGMNVTHPHQWDQVKCGDRVRFRHATTGAWVHAEPIQSQLNHGYEVSGVERDDDKNDWVVECEGDEDPFLDSRVLLRNSEVGCYLGTSEGAEYPPEVASQYEAYCDDSPEGHFWQFGFGIYVTSDEEETDDDDEGDDE